MSGSKIKYLILFLTAAFVLPLYPAPERTLAQPDTSVFYHADRIDYDSSKEMIFLTGNSRLRYKNMQFSAYGITLDLRNNTVEAFAKEDGLTVIGKPVITENREAVEGDLMSYDLDTKQGRVLNARTVLKSARPDDDTYFSTGNMVKLENNDIHGINACITSCDLEHPHWHFRADSIIVTQNNWVFAKPITLYFDEVPVGWFPFVLYKNNRGRNSGFLLPTYYYSNTKGNSLRNFGYFLDISDYADYTLAGDFYDNYGYLIKQNLRYRKRYVLDGYLSADLTNNYSSRDWRIKALHNHNISPSMTLNASADYVTRRSLVKDLGETSADRMANRLFTSGVFSKRWFNTGDNLRAMSSVTQYVDTAIVKYTFPNVSYSLGGRRPFSDTSLPSMIKKFQYDGSFNTVRNVNHYEAKNIFDENTASSFSSSQRTEIGSFRIGSSQNFRINDHKSKFYYFVSGNEFYEINRADSALTDRGLKTNSYVQYSHTMFRYLNFRETFNYKYDTAFRYYDSDLNTVTGVRHRTTHDLNVNMDTKIYGIFQPELWALRKMRHTIAPNLGFTYFPDFSKDRYGYFVTDSLGKKRDVFAPSLIGGTPSGENMRLNYGLMNIFEAKIRVGERDNLIRLFNLNFSGFYNFAADSNKMSVINARLNSNLYNGTIVPKRLRMVVNLNSNAVFTPYTLDGGRGSYINPDLTFWEKNPLRRERWDVNYTVEFPYSLAGALGMVRSDTGAVNYDESGLVIVERGDYTNIPYDIAGRIFFSERYDSNDNYTKSFHGTVGGRISPAENWSVEYRASFNMLVPKKLTSTLISIHRDMHCWQGDFEWDYFNKGFKILISTKSSIFSDIKFDKDTRERRW